MGITPQVSREDLLTQEGASTYHWSLCALLTIFYQGINKFVLLADASDEVPNLATRNKKSRSYADFMLSRAEWEKIELMREVLEVRYRYYSLYGFRSHF